MQLAILLLCLTGVSYSWKLPFNRFSALRLQKLRSSESGMPAAAVHSENVLEQSSIPEISSLNDAAMIHEKAYKVYPFGNLSLPVLPDRDNFWSGKYEDAFWHQNRDHVYVFIPVDDSVSKLDISVVMELFTVTVSIGGKKVHSIVCPHAIGPSSSFWLLERDVNDQKYIHLDLEKRVSYVNWPNLFEHKITNAAGKSTVMDPHKASMLQKLFAANQGLAKLTGGTPESIEQMMDDPELMESLPALEDINPDEASVIQTSADGKMSVVPRNESTGDTVSVGLFDDKK